MGPCRLGWLFAALIAGPVAAESPHEATIRRGIELHDAGSYEAAIKVYESVLQDDPADPLALYEISMSYQALQRFDRCIEYASKVAAIRGSAQAAAFSVLASCLDGADRDAEAISTFERGLALYPKDVVLNYNFGVTLVQVPDRERARKVLRVAIEQAPAYPSPYRVYAMSLAEDGEVAGATLMLMRFLMAEPQSDRAIDAAQQVVDAFADVFEQPQDDGEKKITVRIPENGAADDEADLTFANVALAIANAAPSQTNDRAVIPRGDRLSLAMQVFMFTVGESADRKFKHTFLWKHAIEPLLELEQRNVFDAFAHHVGALARVEGAADWTNQHSEQIERLEQSLAEIHSHR
jgi:tetratricopeptide (TPR) repeat protein